MNTNNLGIEWNGLDEVPMWGTMATDPNTGDITFSNKRVTLYEVQDLVEKSMSEIKRMVELNNSMSKFLPESYIKYLNQKEVIEKRVFPTFIDNSNTLIFTFDYRDAITNDKIQSLFEKLNTLVLEYGRKLCIILHNKNEKIWNTVVKFYKPSRKNTTFNYEIYRNIPWEPGKVQVYKNYNTLRTDITIDEVCDLFETVGEVAYPYQRFIKVYHVVMNHECLKKHGTVARMFVSSVLSYQNTHGFYLSDNEIAQALNVSKWYIKKLIRQLKNDNIIDRMTVDNVIKKYTKPNTHRRFLTVINDDIISAVKSNKVSTPVNKRFFELGVNHAQAIILSEIENKSSNSKYGMGFFASNKYLSKVCGTTKKTIKKYLNNLKSKNLILYVDASDNGYRSIRENRRYICLNEDTINKLCQNKYGYHNANT